MKIDLASFETRKEADVLLPKDAVDLSGERVRLTSDVPVAFVIEKRRDGVRIAGRFGADVVIDCDRCLEPVERRLKAEFDAEFLLPEAFPEAKESELSPDDLKADGLAGDSIDLSELIREQILLEMPQQALCKEDCLGLCSICGGNRNVDPCGCEDNEIDPRWEALKGLN